MTRPLRITIAALLLCGSALTDARAAVPADRFADTLESAGTVLRLRGTGLLSRWFIKGCDIALYVPPDTPPGRVLGPVPRALEFYYYRHIRADQFAHAAWDTLRQNFAESELEALKPQIDRLHAAYRDVDRGDWYRLVYVPGTGTTLYLNGEPLGTVEGEAFASAYFGVWLGRYPLDSQLKRQLMGDTR